MLQQRGVKRVCRLQAVLGKLEANLSAPSQALRLATLRALCCFDQPTADVKRLPSQKPDSPDEPARLAALPCNILKRWAQIEGQVCSIEKGRSAAVAIDAMRGDLEYGRIPDLLLGPLVRCLLGAQHIRSGCFPQPCHMSALSSYGPA